MNHVLSSCFYYEAKYPPPLSQGDTLPSLHVNITVISPSNNECNDRSASSRQLFPPPLWSISSPSLVVSSDKHSRSGFLGPSF